MQEAVWTEGLVAILEAHGEANGAVRQNLWNIADSWRPLNQVAAMDENLYVFNDRLDLVANSCADEGIEITYTSFDLP